LLSYSGTQRRLLTHSYLTSLSFAPFHFPPSALSGAHTVGACHLDRSGFDGDWTDNKLKFDNAYYTEMLSKKYEEETTAKGCPQFRHKESNTMMLISDLALLEEPSFRRYVELYAKDQDAFFRDFAKAWVKLQENGCTDLRETL
jgi:catalase (peroxidase I)